MKSGEWERIQQIVDGALDLAPTERAAWLDRECGDDEGLRRQAEALIRGHDQAGSFLDRAIGNRVDAVMRPSTPSVVGRYRILRLLGEGGMGSVYEAEQDRPRRRVALKLIRPGFVTEEMLRRFENETQALGRLQHPGIARIYEAGSADTGNGPQPYFAMELIEGVSPLDFARANRLDIRQRLELLARVCDAVDHAHQRGIIHRDLKPGNVMVDRAGQPKVLDFGVARITDSETPVTRHTSVGELIGTLTYMSPEQVSGDPTELDVRSDVYSLGVILYELLAGRLPYNSAARQIDEAVAAILIREPSSLSAINRAYRGDIETVVAKALEKDKTRRYGSAASFSEDIRRYLHDEPIVARPPSVAYQLRKLARRHRPLVIGAAAVILVLVSGVVVSTDQAIRARTAERSALRERDRATAAGAAALAAQQAATRERDRAIVAEAQSLRERNAAIIEKQRADEERAASAAVNDFLRGDLLAQASARMQAGSAAPDPDLKVRTALDRAAAKIAGRFDSQPAVEASIQQTIGDTYLDLGLADQAEQHIKRALDLRRRTLGEGHPDTLTALERLAMVYTRIRGRYEQAEQLMQTVVKGRRRLSGEHDSGTLRSIGNLVVVYIARGKYDEAEQLLGPLIENSRRILGEKHPETLHNWNSLAIVYTEQGRYELAEPIQVRVLEGYRSLGDERQPAVILALNNLANTYDREGKYTLAEPLFVKAVEDSRVVLGQENLNTLLYENNLGDLWRKTGRAAEAEQQYNRVLAIRRLVLGDANPDTLITMMSLARVYRDQGDNEKAVQLFRDVLSARRRNLGGEHPYTLISMYELARTYERIGMAGEAEQLHTSVVEIRKRVLGARNSATLISLMALGITQIELGKYSEAEVTLRECLRGSEETVPDNWRRFAVQSALGASLLGQRRYSEAEPLLLAGQKGLIQRRSTIPQEDQSALEQVEKWLEKLYTDWGT